MSSHDPEEEEEEEEEEKEGGKVEYTEGEKEAINRRRIRMLNLVRDYQSEADLLRDIDWTKSAHVF